MPQAIMIILVIALAAAGAVTAWYAASAQAVVLAILAAALVFGVLFWLIQATDNSRTGDEEQASAMLIALILAGVAIYVAGLLLARLVLWIGQPLVAG